MTSGPGPDDLLSAAEVAELFGCSPGEVTVLARDAGVAPVLRGRERWYRRVDVMRVWAEWFGHSPRE